MTRANRREAIFSDDDDRRHYLKTLEKQAHGEQEARRLVAEGMAIAGLSDEDVEKLPGGDLRKVAMARVVWERTAVGTPRPAEQFASVPRGKRQPANPPPPAPA